jgi:putative MATE family efflux protein
MQPSRTLIEGSLSRGLILFALPILFGNVLQTVNGSINSVWVGQFLGEASLAATSNANTVMFLLLGGVFGLSMAATILVGQNIGAGNLHEAKRVVGTSATFFAALSTVMAAAGWLLSERLLAAMSTPAASIPLATAYMRVIFLALPFMYMYAFVMAVLRGAGDSKTPFYFLVLSVALDIALNPLFIFGLGPVPRLGIAGSALATFVAQAVSLVALIASLYRRKHVLCLHRDELGLLRIDGAIVATLVRKGIPMGLQIFVISLSSVLMLSLVNRFGVNTTAAFGAGWQVWNYIQMSAFALGMAVSAVAAQNVGAQKWDRVAATARIGVLYNFLLTGSLILLVEIFGRAALALFLPAGSPALPLAVHANRIVAVTFVFFGVSTVLFGVVRATGAVVVPLLILTLTVLVTRFSVAYIFVDRWHSDAIWWSFPLSGAALSAFALIYYKFGGWRTARMAPAVPIPLALNAQRRTPQAAAHERASQGARRQ